MTYPNVFRALCRAAFVLVAVSAVAYADGMSEELYWLRIGEEMDDLGKVAKEIQDKKYEISRVYVCKIPENKYALTSSDSRKSEADIMTSKLYLEQSKTYGDAPLSVIRADAFDCFSGVTLFAKEGGPANSGAETLEKPYSTIPLPMGTPKQHIDTRNLKYKKPDPSGEVIESSLNNQNDDINVYPEIKSVITLSNRFTNVMECPRNLEVHDIITSEERPIKTMKKGPVVYVKFQVGRNEDDGKVFYEEDPAEFYVICGNNEYRYKMIALPKNVSAKTVKLLGIGEKAEKNQSLFKGLAFEQKIVRIMQEAVIGEFPESYTIMKKDEEVVLNAPEVTVRLRNARNIKIEGEGLMVKEYLATASADVIGKIKEKHFLNKELSSKPYAVMIDKSVVGNEHRLRAYLIENRGE